VPFSLVQALSIIRQHYRKTVPSEEDNNVIVVIWAGFRSFVFTSLSKNTSIALRLITGGHYVWCCSKLVVYSYVPLNFCNPPLFYIVPVTSAAGNANPSGAPEFIPDSKWGTYCSIVCLQYFVDLCLFPWPFFFWTLYCMPFDLRIMIAPLVSSKCSCQWLSAGQWFPPLMKFCWKWC
jgi:hypothetical protein